MQDIGGNSGCVGAQDEFCGFGIVVGVAVADGAESSVLVYFADVVVVLLVVKRRRGGRGQAGIVEFCVLFQGFHGGVGDGVGTGEVGGDRIGDVEGVLKITGGVLLGDEESVKVPETSVDESAGVSLVNEVERRQFSDVLTCRWASQ